MALAEMAKMDSGVINLGLVGPLPPPNGGMAMQTRQLARLLKQEGVKVELVQNNAPYWPPVIENIRGLRALFRLVPFLYRVYRMAGRVDLIHLLANSGWSWQLFAAPVVWIGWFRKTPVIVNYRGGAAREYLSSSEGSIRPTIRRASRLVVPSGFLQSVFREFGFSSEIVPNIIDLETFYPVERQAPTAEFVLAITRNLEPIYGIDTAIRALAMVSRDVAEIRLKIAGSGDQQEELEALAKELGVSDKIDFLGRLEREEIVKLYQSADLAVNPSRVDNMPNSVLEAMACGVPVVSTNVGGVPYIVEHEKTALLIEPDQPGALADAILRVYKERDLRKQLVDNAIQETRQYSWKRVGPQWIALYGNLKASTGSLPQNAR